MRKLSLILVTVVFMAGCSYRNAVTFEGNISGCDGCYLTVSRTCAGETQYTDSVQVRGGRFSLDIPAGKNGPDFFCISLRKDNAFTTLADKGEKVHIKADAASLARTCRVTGSRDAELMCQLDHQLACFSDSTDHLMELYYYYYYNDTMRAKIEEVYMTIKANHAAFLRNFIVQNSESLSSLAALYQRYNRGVFLPEEENLELASELCAKLKSQYPNNGNVRWLEERLARHAPAK